MSGMPGGTIAFELRVISRELCDYWLFADRLGMVPFAYQLRIVVMFLIGNQPASLCMRSQDSLFLSSSVLLCDHIN